MGESDMTNTEGNVRAGEVFEADVALDTRDPDARAFFEKEYDRLRAENARLREALSRVAYYGGCYSNRQRRRIARHALEGSE